MSDITNKIIPGASSTLDSTVSVSRGLRFSAYTIFTYLIFSLALTGCVGATATPIPTPSSTPTPPPTVTKFYIPIDTPVPTPKFGMIFFKADEIGNLSYFFDYSEYAKLLHKHYGGSGGASFTQFIEDFLEQNTNVSDPDILESGECYKLEVPYHLLIEYNFSD